jgi:hypothetical protein
VILLYRDRNFDFRASLYVIKAQPITLGVVIGIY